MAWELYIKDAKSTDAWVVDEAGEYVAMGMGPNRRENATLIAAAPDMLAALETALEMLVDSWGEEQIAAGDDQVANVLKAAIAKAKGDG